MDNEEPVFAEVPPKPEETPNQKHQREQYEKNSRTLWRIRNAVAQFSEVQNESEFLAAVRELSMAAVGVLDDLATEQVADFTRAYERRY